MKFDDFAGAMAWNNVRLIPTTRSAGRRTENDHEMARRIGAR